MKRCYLVPVMILGLAVLALPSTAQSQTKAGRGCTPAQLAGFRLPSQKSKGCAQKAPKCGCEQKSKTTVGKGKKDCGPTLTDIFVGIDASLQRIFPCHKLGCCVSKCDDSKEPKGKVEMLKPTRVRRLLRPPAPMPPDDQLFEESPFEDDAVEIPPVPVLDASYDVESFKQVLKKIQRDHPSELKQAEETPEPPQKFAADEAEPMVELLSFSEIAEETETDSPADSTTTSLRWLTPAGE